MKRWATKNFFLFGLTAAEVAAAQAAGYDPKRFYEKSEGLREAVSLIASGAFSNGDRKLFEPLVRSLMQHDPYMLFADYEAYVACQDRVSAAFRDADGWTRRSIVNMRASPVLLRPRDPRVLRADLERGAGPDQPIVGMTNSASARMPVGQRVVIVFRRV